MSVKVSCREKGSKERKTKQKSRQEVKAWRTRDVIINLGGHWKVAPNERILSPSKPTLHTFLKFSWDTHIEIYEGGVNRMQLEPFPKFSVESLVLGKWTDFTLLSDISKWVASLARYLYLTSKCFCLLFVACFFSFFLLRDNLLLIRVSKLDYVKTTFENKFTSLKKRIFFNKWLIKWIKDKKKQWMKAIFAERFWMLNLITWFNVLFLNSNQKLANFFEFRLYIDENWFWKVRFNTYFDENFSSK